LLLEDIQREQRANEEAVFQITANLVFVEKVHY
jgi:hypothetical protein